MSQNSSHAAPSAWSDAVAGWDALFADLVETLANFGLSLDDDAAQRLAALEGRRLRIQCKAPAKTVTLGVQSRRLSLSAEAIGAADVTVSGAAADLLAWAWAGFGKGADKLEMEGDAALVAEFAAALRPSGLDAVFARLPDNPGEDLLGALELAGAVLRSAVEGGAAALQRGLGEAPADAPPGREFAAAVRELRERVDGLQARVRDLEEGGENSQQGAAQRPGQ